MESPNFSLKNANFAGADFGDYDFDVFPHLLKYESDRLEFVLQREIPVKDNSSREKTAGTLLFEYTD